MPQGVTPGNGMVFYSPPQAEQGTALVMKKPRVVRAKTFQSRMDRISPEPSGGLRLRGVGRRST